jgi:hypothetical protein
MPFPAPVRISSRIDFAFFAISRLDALRADTMNDQTVSGNVEVLFAGHAVPQFDEIVALEFEEPVALFTIQVVMLGIAVVVFVDSPSVQFELPQQAGIDELGQGPIDRRTADVSGVSLGGKLRNELVGVEVLVMAENVVDQDPSLFGVPHSAALEVLGKPLLRRQRDLNRA